MRPSRYYLTRFLSFSFLFRFCILIIGNKRNDDTRRGSRVNHVLRGGRHLLHVGER